MAASAGFGLLHGDEDSGGIVLGPSNSCFVRDVKALSGVAPRSLSMPGRSAMPGLARIGDFAQGALVFPAFVASG